MLYATLFGRLVGSLEPLNDGNENLRAGTLKRDIVTRERLFAVEAGTGGFFEE